MITVLSPGARTLVQDGGRGGHEHLGVPTSGAFDPALLAVANRLVGNLDDHAPALEVTALGPALRFERAATVALAGRFTHATVDGAPVPAFHTVHVPAGATVSVGPLTGALRGYLAVAGGFASDPVLGSASTCTLSGLGPAPLAAGQSLPTGSTRHEQVHRAAAVAPTGRALRVLPGPHQHLFTPAALAALTGTAWRVSPNSSRVGVRLAGEPVQAPTESLPSLGMVTGAVQVPPSGLPIVLGPDHGATGGYPVPFVVVSADLGVLAQATPGDPVTLVPVSAAPDAARTRVWDLTALTA